MSRKGFVYKLYCEGIDDFYIGSCWNIKHRKKNHKSNCNNLNSNDYNRKVYTFIRANGGIDNWKYEILVEKEFENKRELQIKEQDCINLLKPTLNSQKAYLSKEELKQRMLELSKKRNQIKINCDCGGKTSIGDKSHHEKTKKHQKYLKTINNITNITYNITINK